jgi:CheY-like chemotaxis protein
LSVITTAHVESAVMASDVELPPACPRCLQRETRSLGLAGSQLQWFTCKSCQHVWADGAAPQPAPAPAPTVSGSRKRVLVVDDDTSVLAIVERTLSDYRVSTARDAAEALAILSAQNRIDLLITDYLMPVMTGEELAHRARELRPSLKILVLTGHALALEHAEPVWWASEPHVVKPFRFATLRDAVTDLIGPA